VLGDSVSAAFGIPAARGWVALLAQRLKQERLDYSVVNASISGDTTAGGLARLPAALQKTKPAVVIVELGGNDGLRGLPVAQMKANLEAIVLRSQNAGARVLVLGMKIPPNYGPDYIRSFEGVYRDLAKQYRLPLLPFLLRGVGGHSDLMQRDGIHPTAEGNRIVARNVMQVLEPLLHK